MSLVYAGIALDDLTT